MSLEASDDMDDSGFDESGEGEGKREKELHNDKYDVALEVSASNDLSEPGAPRRKDVLLRNDKFDEALDVSASMEMPSADFNSPAGAAAAAAASSRPADRGGSPARRSDDRGGVKPVKNDQFDATLDISSGDDESSVDTRSSEVKKAVGKRSVAAMPGEPASAAANRGLAGSGGGAGGGLTASASAAAERSASGRPAGAAAGLSLSSPSPAVSNARTTNEASSSRPTPAVGSMSGSDGESSGSEEDSEDLEGADAGAGGAGGRGRQASIKLEGAYNPEDYARLSVSAEIKELFQYIQRYKPHEVELETTLRCFVPDYIPAVGEMDAFIKVPRPDGGPDDLGLKVLDEPAANQSDATVLELQLRAVSKRQHGDVAVHSIEDAAKNPAEVDRWIASIDDLHRAKPPPQVNYKRSMPEVDALMEVWAPEMEAHLLTGAPLLPSAEVELSLEEYCRAACALFDIPVHDNGGMIESLHLLVTVYLEFRANQHFQGAVGMAGPSAPFLGSSYK